MLDGKIPPVIMNKNGVARFSSYEEFKSPLHDMTRNVAHSVFAETYNALLEKTLNTTAFLGEILNTVTPTTTFSKKTLLKQVATVIKARSVLGSERDVFFLRMGGFDTHKDIHTTVSSKFGQIDTDLKAFEDEMVIQGVWDNVALLAASDFGRALRSNGGGTDHAWAGHTFMVGGALDGGKFHGQYPASLAEDGPLNVRTGGRFIPTTSWEAVWHALAGWFGVRDEQMDAVLPNMKNFPADDMIQKDIIFLSICK